MIYVTKDGRPISWLYDSYIRFKLLNKMDRENRLPSFSFDFFILNEIDKSFPNIRVILGNEIYLQLMNSGIYDMKILERVVRNIEHLKERNDWKKTRMY